MSGTFGAYLEEYVHFLEEMAEKEKEKYEALVSYDPKRVDKAIATQEAWNMRLAKMEEMREQEQERAGFGGLSFREILDRLDGEEREEFSRLFRRFRKAVDDLKYFNGRALAFAREGMRAFSSEESQAQAASYTAGKKAAGTGEGPSLFEAKV